MATYTLTEILEATGGRLLLRGAETFSGVSIDSRTIKDGELFVALRGDRFDGHDFVDEALKIGAGAVVSYPPVIPQRGKSIIIVPNSLKALQAIARFRRLQRSTKVVGVTGTNGKTTTKEMINSILSRRFSVLISKGNLNNHIGLPLTLTGLNGQSIAVLEMGASAPGDIRDLCKIALPDVGVITNIGPAHLEGFGSLEMVRETKLEIQEFVKTLVINGDDHRLYSSAKEKNSTKEMITFGMAEGLDVRAEGVIHTDKGVSFDLLIKNEESIRVNLSVFGNFNVYNALAATAVARSFGLSLEVIKEGLEKFRGVPMRLEIKELHGATVISDLYNANPASMEEAIKELVSLKKRRAIAVLGDMLELGAYSEVAHRNLGRWVSTLPVDVVIAVGRNMSYLAEEFSSTNGNVKVYQVDSPEQARAVLLKIVNEGDTVLIKGSRGMKMEKVLEG